MTSNDPTRPCNETEPADPRYGANDDQVDIRSNSVPAIARPQTVMRALGNARHAREMLYWSDALRSGVASNSDLRACIPYS